MTTRMSFLVFGKRTQSGVTLAGTAAQAGRQRGNERRLQIPRDGNPGDGRDQNCSKGDEDRGAEAGAATAERPGDQLRGADGAERTADTAADGFVPLAEGESYGDTGGYGEDECGGQRSSRACQHSRQKHPDCDAQPCADTDPVPATHREPRVVFAA